MVNAALKLGVKGPWENPPGSQTTGIIPTDSLAS
jgi:hypothetical protein